MKNKALIVFVNNIFEKNSGTKTRLYQLLEYFKSRGILVDQFVEKRGAKEFEKDNIKFDYDLINEFYLGYNLNKTVSFKIKRELKRAFLKIFKKKRINVDKHSDKVVFHNFNKIIKNNYDWIVFVRNSDIKFLKKIKTKTICLVEDFTTLDGFQKMKEFNQIGKSFQEELNFYKKMDNLIFISKNEKVFFDSFLNKQSYFIPHFMDFKYKENRKGKYDICYLASDNPHNIAGCNWFLKTVYPLLPKTYRIVFVGKITTKISNKKEYENIKFIEFVENLDDIYLKSKVSICPMLSGTGIKIKVIEAMSYGLPVITTSKGAIGFKKNEGCNITDDPKEFAFAISIILKDKKLLMHQQSQSILSFKEHFERNQNYNKLDKIFIDKYG